MNSTPVKLVLLAGLGLTFVGSIYTPPAAAQVMIGMAPPPPRFERPPPPRYGYEWAPGYWRWNGRRHVWIGGHWMRGRRGFHYRPSYWVNGPRGWYLHEGYWVR